jgi:hypothetical protein
VARVFVYFHYNVAGSCDASEIKNFVFVKSSSKGLYLLFVSVSDVFAYLRINSAVENVTLDLKKGLISDYLLY